MSRNKNFIAQFEALLEAVGMTGEEEVIPQENIADSGEDALPQGQNDAEVQTADNVPVAPMPEPTTPGSDLSSQKTLRLYELFEKLVDYGVTFIESLESVDVGLLDENRHSKFSIYLRNMKELVDKINNYMTEIFMSDNYERELYTYVLFRTELISNIKGLRDTLKLEDPNEDLKKKN